MRIAVMIISLVLMVVILLQSCAAGIGSQLATTQSQHDSFSNGGAAGVLVGFLFLLGGALVIGFPRLAVALFIVAGAIGLIGGSSIAYHDLTVWGSISLVLAGMSYLGSRSKRREAARKAKETELQRSVAASLTAADRQSATTQQGLPCPACGANNDANARFCAACGVALGGASPVG